MNGESAGVASTAFWSVRAAMPQDPVGRIPAPPPPPPEAATATTEGGRVRVETPDGRQIIIGPGGVNVRAGTEQAVAVGVRDLVPDGVITISLGFFVMIVMIVVGLPVARAVGRRLERSTPTSIAPEFRQELHTLRESVDQLSVDVERVAEGQRWMTKRLAEAQPAERHADRRS